MKKSILLKVLITLVAITATLFLSTACKSNDVTPLEGSFKYKIEFYVDGEKVHTVDTKDANFSMPENPSKAGYVFDGWYLDENTWQKLFKKGELKTSAISNKLKLYAKFTAGHVHEYIKTITPATCTVDGYSTYNCSCGDSYTADEVKAVGSHEYQTAIIIAPTCTEKGYDLLVCKNCGSQNKVNYVNALDHDFENYVSDNNATATENGTKTAVCERAGCNETDTIVDEGSAYGNGIVFKTLTVNGETVSGSVNNSVLEFNFNNELTLTNGFTFKVSKSSNGTNESKTGVVELLEGNNVFYVSAIYNKNVIKTYAVFIYRAHLYEVKFIAYDDVEIDRQFIEEGSKAIAPTENPTKTGYTFTGWDFDFNNAITGEVTVNATWQINTFTVTFNALDRGTLNGEAQRTLSAVGYELPTVNAKAGSVFMGWKCDGELVTSDFVFTKNCELVADYVVTGYTVTYVYEGTLKRNGKTIVLTNNSEVLAKTGYVLPTVENGNEAFGGWLLQGTNEKFDGSKELTTEITLVATTISAIRFTYNGENIIEPISIELGVTYDKNVTGLNEALQNITVKKGYHLALYNGENEFTSIKFDKSEDVKNVVIEAKEVENKGAVIIKIWGPENDTSTGTVNGGYSATLENVKTGDEIIVTLVGEGDYEFVYFADTNWDENVSDAPTKSTVINDGKILVETDGATITIYAFFYSYIIR